MESSAGPSVDEWTRVLDRVEGYAFVRIDEDGTVRGWNEGVRRLLGYGTKEFLGQSWHTFLCNPRAGDSQGELQVRHRDGSRLAVRCMVLPFGGDAGFMVVVRVLSSAAYEQDAARRRSEEMERRVVERTVELSQAVNLLEQQLVERRRLEVALAEAEETERERLGQDLHDGICQQLTGTAMLAQVLAVSLSRRGAPEAERAQQVVDLMKGAILQARDLAKGLHPVSLQAEHGLVAALEELTTRTSVMVPCRLRSPSWVDLAPDVSLHLYRIAQEAVRNALKHAGASEIVLSLEVQKGLLHLRVRDNGRGLKEADRLRGGMGLLNLQYRTKALGAELHFESEPSRGTTVTCLLPVDPRVVAGAPSPVERTPQLQLF